MGGEVTNGLEDALRAAIASHNAGEAGGGAPNDLLSLFVKVLPRLLENTEERDELGDMLGESVSALRDENKSQDRKMNVIYKRLVEIENVEKEILAKLTLLGDANAAVADFLDRLEIEDTEYDAEYDDELEEDDHGDHVPDIVLSDLDRRQTRGNTRGNSRTSTASKTGRKVPRGPNKARPR